MVEREYAVGAELPGVDPEKDIQITISNGILTIHAERREEIRSRHRSEFRYGMLQCSVRLPDNADDESVTANYGTGILEITVPLKATEPTASKSPARGPINRPRRCWSARSDQRRRAPGSAPAVQSVGT